MSHQARRPVPLPDPPLTDRGAGIGLRPWQARDGPALVEAWADPEIGRWTAVPDQHGPAGARRWIEREAARRAAGLSIDLVVAGIDDDRLRGEVGLVLTEPARGWAEIGFWSTREWRRRGATTAAVALLVRWALGPPLALHQLYARVDQDNGASTAILARCRFDDRGPVSGGHHLWVRRAGDTLAT